MLIQVAYGLTISPADIPKPPFVRSKVVLDRKEKEKAPPKCVFEDSKLLIVNKRSIRS